jgi:hypothetical protein
MDVNGQMHPGTVAVMVTELEEDPNVLASTGYPLDVPPPDATIWAWVMCQFRYNCLSQFVSNHSDVCWGGAMMMRKADFDDDTCEVKSRWENGGYSDDMLVAACAADYGRAIATPLRAIFPNGMKKDVTFSDTWDFLRRQIFVLTTYGSCPNCMKHSFLLFAYATLNALPAYAFFTAILTLICLIVHACYTSFGVMLCSNFSCSCAFLASLAWTVFIAKKHLHTSVKLTKVLSPEAAPMDVSHVSYLMLTTSLILQSSLAPFVTVFTLCNRSIVWGGITYRVRWGRVVEIERPNK